MTRMLYFSIRFRPGAHVRGHYLYHRLDNTFKNKHSFRRSVDQLLASAICLLRISCENVLPLIESLRNPSEAENGRAHGPHIHKPWYCNWINEMGPCSKIWICLCCQEGCYQQPECHPAFLLEDNGRILMHPVLHQDGMENFVPTSATRTVNGERSGKSVRTLCIVIRMIP